MTRRLVSTAFALAALHAVATVRAADAICSKDISKCYVNGGSKTCDREDEACAPCLEKMDGGFFDFLNPKYACHELDDDGKCPSGSSDCSVVATPAPSPTPKPTKTPKTPKTPAPANSTSGSTSGASDSSDASSSSSGSAMSSKTPTPSPTPKPSPTPSPTPSLSLSPSPSPTPTRAPQATETASPSNATGAKDSSTTGTSIGVVLAIVGGVGVVLAVLGFLVWKRRQEDDDESDDDDGGRFNPPPPKVDYSQSSTSTAFAAGATTFSKPPAPAYASSAAQPGHMVTSPRQNQNQHTYALPVAGPITSYDSPSGVPNSQRSGGFSIDPPAAEGGYRLSDDHSVSSSEGRRDVWGNTVGSESFRDKRSASNVSVEF